MWFVEMNATKTALLASGKFKFLAARITSHVVCRKFLLARTLERIKIGSFQVDLSHWNNEEDNYLHEAGGACGSEGLTSPFLS